MSFFSCLCHAKDILINELINSPSTPLKCLKTISRPPPPVGLSREITVSERNVRGKKSLGINDRARPICRFVLCIVHNLLFSAKCQNSRENLKNSRSFPEIPAWTMNRSSSGFHPNGAKLSLFTDRGATLRLCVCVCVWGGGGNVSEFILGVQDTFSYYLFIILKIIGGGGHVPCSPSPPAPRSLLLTRSLSLEMFGSPLQRR